MSGSSLTNFLLTRNPGDENQCYFKTPGSTLVLENSVRLLIVQLYSRWPFQILYFWCSCVTN